MTIIELLYFDIVVSDTCSDLSTASGDGLLKAQMRAAAEIFVNAKSFDDQPKTPGGDLILVRPRIQMVCDRSVTPRAWQCLQRDTLSPIVTTIELLYFERVTARQSLLFSLSVSLRKRHKL